MDARRWRADSNVQCDWRFALRAVASECSVRHRSISGASRPLGNRDCVSGSLPSSRPILSSASRNPLQACSASRMFACISAAGASSRDGSSIRKSRCRCVPRYGTPRCAEAPQAVRVGRASDRSRLRGAGARGGPFDIAADGAPAHPGSYLAPEAGAGDSQACSVKVGFLGLDTPP